MVLQKIYYFCYSFCSTSDNINHFKKTNLISFSYLPGSLNRQSLSKINFLTVATISLIFSGNYSYKEPWIKIKNCWRSLSWSVEWCHLPLPSTSFYWNAEILNSKDLLEDLWILHCKSKTTSSSIWVTTTKPTQTNKTRKENYQIMLIWMIIYFLDSLFA